MKRVRFARRPLPSEEAIEALVERFESVEMELPALLIEAAAEEFGGNDGDGEAKRVAEANGEGDALRGKHEVAVAFDGSIENGAPGARPDGNMIDNLVIAMSKVQVKI